MNKKPLLVLIAVLVFSLIFLPLSSAGANPAGSPPIQTEPPATADLSDRQALETFVDDLVRTQIKINKTPGLAVVIVQGDEIILSKGYGYIDEEEQIAVDPAKTLFRIGSLSTIPTAFAIMQLVEQGKLDLETDVNQYLPDFKIKDAFDQPVTVRYLLNRTGGFDTLTWIGEPGLEAQDKLPLSEYVRKTQPARIFPPGTQVNPIASSYDYLLAGYLVEAVSGVPFEKYMEENVFPLLSANSSTYRQPVPDSLSPFFSQGYEVHGPYADPYPYHYYNAVSANGMSASPEDMARFIIPLLNNGQLGGESILQESSVDVLLQQKFSYHPQLSGQASTFSEFNYNGHRGLFMIDLMMDYSSAIYLLPEQQVGILLFANSLMGNLLIQLPTQFCDRYQQLPAQSEETALPSASFTAEELERYTGFYHKTGLPERTFWKTFLIQGTWETAKVTLDENGNLNIRGGAGLYSWDTDWEPVDDVLFRFASNKKEAWTFISFDRDGYVAFGENEKGEVTYIYSGTTSYERMAWYEDAALHILLFALCLGAFGTYLWQEVILWFIHWWTIPAYEEKGKLELSKSRYIARLLASLACLLGSGIILTLLALLLTDITWLQKYTPERQISFLNSVMAFPMIFLVLVPGVLAATVFVWKGRYWTLKNRLYYTAVTVASTVALWQFNVWNVLGYQF